MIIERARVLVGKPEAWTRYTFAATVDNRHLEDVLDPQARRFCARGALERVAYDLVGPEAHRQAADAAESALCAGTRIELVTVNDRDGRKAVLRVFDKWLRKNS